MLAIRLQRVGRKGYAQYRIIVQDAQRSPTSGRVVANLGHFNPHTKEVSLDKDTAKKYLNNGAQPSPRVAQLLKAEKIKLPDWVEVAVPATKRTTKNPEKLRKNRPAEEEPEETAPASAEQSGAAEEASTEATTPSGEKPEEKQE